MGKSGGFLTPKAIANRIKAKGLQKLRWYCQMCEKQCRDENGFKVHLPPLHLHLPPFKRRVLTRFSWPLVVSHKFGIAPAPDGHGSSAHQVRIPRRDETPEWLLHSFVDHAE